MTRAFNTHKLMLGLLILGAGVIAALTGSMFATTPDQLGPFGITVWFLLAIAGSWAVVGGIIYIFLWWLKRPNSVATALQVGGLASGYFVLLVALNSLRQLNLTDIVLVSLLVLLTGFYLRKV